MRAYPARAVRTSPYDRQILALAVPALGALAAEPLYLLVDTAIVGHLGTPQLAALALAATVLSAVVGLCNFLAYATTAQVARLHGGGREAAAGEIAAQALWLALGVGAVAALGCVVLADPLMALLGGEGRTAELAARYLRLSALGLPCALIAVAGQGYLRGTGDLRTPLVILITANLANVVLELWLVYGLDLGLDGSALGTVIAQLGMGAAFTVALLRAGGAGVSRRPQPVLLRRLSRMGSDIVIRTASLLAAFTLARTGADALGAHAIAFQLFVFLALVLDAIAIAGQVMVGRMLGAGDADGARAASARMLGWSLVVGVVLGGMLLAGTRLIPGAFTDDGAVLDQAARLWPLFAALMPIGALVFALDGILIGAGDTRYIARAMALAAAVYAPVVIAAGILDWGVVGVWAALHVLMAARLVTMWVRFRTPRWQLVGAPT
jgi:putative MATE family efflux protein